MKCPSFTGHQALFMNFQRESKTLTSWLVVSNIEGKPLMVDQISPTISTSSEPAQPTELFWMNGKLLEYEWRMKKIQVIAAFLTALTAHLEFGCLPPASSQPPREWTTTPPFCPVECCELWVFKQGSWAGKTLSLTLRLLLSRPCRGLRWSGCWLTSLLLFWADGLWDSS